VQALSLDPPAVLSHQKFAGAPPDIGVSLLKFFSAMELLRENFVLDVAYCVLQKLAASTKLSRKDTSSPVLAVLDDGILYPLLEVEAQQPKYDVASFFTVKSRSRALLGRVQLNQLLTMLRAVDLEYAFEEPKIDDVTTSLRIIREYPLYVAISIQSEQSPAAHAGKTLLLTPVGL